MNFINLVSQSDMKDVGILLRSALDRIPLVIKGKEPEIVENVINGLINLLSFRNYVTFYNDFTTEQDYQELVRNEEMDFMIQRNLYVSYPYSFSKLIDNIHIFNSWIIGYNPESDEAGLNFKIFSDILYSEHTCYLVVNLYQNRFTSELIGRSFSNLNLSFEKWVYSNAIQNTEKSIEKMKRIISKGVKDSDFE